MIVMSNVYRLYEACVAANAYPTLLSTALLDNTHVVYVQETANNFVAEVYTYTVQQPTTDNRIRFSNVSLYGTGSRMTTPSLWQTDRLMKVTSQSISVLWQHLLKLGKFVLLYDGGRCASDCRISPSYKPKRREAVRKEIATLAKQCTAFEHTGPVISMSDVGVTFDTTTTTDTAPQLDITDGLIDTIRHMTM